MYQAPKDHCDVYKTGKPGQFELQRKLDWHILTPFMLMVNSCSLLFVNTMNSNQSVLSSHMLHPLWSLSAVVPMPSTQKSPPSQGRKQAPELLRVGYWGVQYVWDTFCKMFQASGHVWALGLWHWHRCCGMLREIAVAGALSCRLARSSLLSGFSFS